MRTLEEVLNEVMNIINTTNEVEARLQRLKATGYQMEYNWVKNGGIGTVFFMKRQQVYRIQVALSERCGNYHKAYCIVIPVGSVSPQLTETIKVRNMPAVKKPEGRHNGSANRNNNII
jgi:hypothetical protein